MFTSDFAPASTSAAGRSPADTSSAGRTDTKLAERAPRSDTECRARAQEFLVDLIGTPPDDLCWDRTHRLQGHAHVGGHELIVIAPRDEAHRTVVLTAQDWEQVRRAGSDQRRSLLGACAIADRSRLAAVLARGELMAAA
jgi:hypothetical protein